jgi:hypothetical protein
MGTFSNAAKNTMLDAIGTQYVQLHTGDPGAAGTSNVATNTTRKSANLGAAASGARTNSSEVRWATGETETETLTHVSFWTASSGGTFQGSDDLPTGVAVTAGDEFFIAAGDIDLTL